jgi:hypothetical protein
MAGRPFRLRIFVTILILCAVVVLTLVVVSRSSSYERGRLRLPVGNRTPAISLSERHGLILASETDRKTVAPFQSLTDSESLPIYEKRLPNS